jgi:Family of unknown function (DUF6177)
MAAMSDDWVVRTPEPLDLPVLVDAMASAVPDAAVRTDATESWVVVVDRQDVPRLWISPGRTESGRDHVLSEVCAPGGDGLPPFATSTGMTRAAAEALAEASGGHAERLSASTEAPDDRSAAPDPAPQHHDREPVDSPMDLVTSRLALLTQTRPRVTLTSWLLLASRWSAQHARRLVVVTPAASTLSHAVTALLRDQDALWVVDAQEVVYDGFTGRELTFDGEDFLETDDPSPVPAYAAAAEDDWRLLVVAETMHPYDESTTVGQFARAVYAAAGLTSPVASGVLEPPEAAFESSALTAYAQEASPNPSRFTLRGESSDGVLQTRPQPPGLVERVEIVADTQDEPRPYGTADDFAASVLGAGAQTATLGYARFAPDRGTPARFLGPVVPAVAVFARSRFPTLTDAEARRLGGPSARLLSTPIPALVVEYDLAPSDGNDGESAPQENAILGHARLVSELEKHDEHVLLARRHQA